MDLEKCRICLERGLLSNIFEKHGSTLISSKIMCLAKVQIHPNDGLPSTICSKCIRTLNKCIKFVELCEHSDSKLRTLIKEDSSVNFDTEHSDFDKNDLLLNMFPLKREDCPEFCIENNTGNKYLEDSGTKSEISNLNIDCDDSNIKIKKEQKQQCFTCGKVMSSRFRLKTHLRTHTGERPYSCPHCNKNFSLAQNLKVHIRVHTGEKPLKCSVCGECFAHSAGLAAHKRKHTGQMPYRCMLCPRNFRTVGHLQYHTRRHTGEKNFECDSCGRAFITRSDLKQHLLTHTGDRPHVCCVCGVRLTRASHLKRHILQAHNTQKTFICTQCPKQFTQKSELEKHRFKHVAKKPLEKT